MKTKILLIKVVENQEIQEYLLNIYVNVAHLVIKNYLVVMK